MSYTVTVGPCARNRTVLILKTGTEFSIKLGLCVYSFNSSAYQEFHTMFPVSYRSIGNIMCFVFRDEGNEQMILYVIGLVSNQYISGNQKLYT